MPSCRLEIVNARCCKPSAKTVSCPIASLTATDVPPDEKEQCSWHKVICPCHSFCLSQYFSPPLRWRFVSQIISTSHRNQSKRILLWPGLNKTNPYGQKFCCSAHRAPLNVLPGMRFFASRRSAQRHAFRNQPTRYSLACVDKIT